MRIHQAQLNVQRGTQVQSTTAGDTAHRNRWSSTVTSVEPVITSTGQDTETISSHDIRVTGDTQSQPVRKSPRLRQLEDDEVVEVPPPPKVYTVVDLTEEGMETTSTVEQSATTQTTTPIRRRGRPSKASSQTQSKDKKNTTTTPSKNA